MSEMHAVAMAYQQQADQTRQSMAKGQLNSEWIYEVVISP